MVLCMFFRYVYLDSTSAFFFFFNGPATTVIYTLSLHDALPIFYDVCGWASGAATQELFGIPAALDRKSTRLNSSHVAISYAVFCLKKKNYPGYLYGFIECKCIIYDFDDIGVSNLLCTY